MLCLFFDSQYTDTVLTDPNFYFLLLGWFVLGVFVFKRELLISKNGFKLILSISAVLFTIGLFCHIAFPGTKSASGALLLPLMHLILYRASLFAFETLFHRTPKDTAGDWGSGLFWDRCFNVGFVALATVSFVLVIKVMRE